MKIFSISGKLIIKIKDKLIFILIIFVSIQGNIILVISFLFKFIINT